MTIQEFSQSVQTIVQNCGASVKSTETLLQKVHTVIDDQKIFAEAIRKPEEANQQQIQALMSRYGASSDSDLYNKIQIACTTMVRLIQEEKAAVQELIHEGQGLLSKGSIQGSESLQARLSLHLPLPRIAYQTLSENENLLVDQLRQMPQAPTPMEGVVGTPLSPQVESLVQNLDEKWKKPVSDLLSHLTPFALNRIGKGLKQDDLPRLLQLGADYINAHQGELAYIGLEKLIALGPRVLEKLPHKVLRGAGPRAIFSMNPMVLNQLPVELLAYLNGQNLEQFALLDDADIEYFRTMKPEQRIALGKYAELIRKIPLSKLMRLTANENALEVLIRINRTHGLEIPKEFWEDIHPEIWNEFSKDVCAALTPAFFEALYGINVTPHQYRSIVTNHALTLLLQYLTSSPVITTDGLKIKIDNLAPEAIGRARESTRFSEEAEGRKWAAYIESYRSWFRYLGPINLPTTAALGWIYRSSYSALLANASKTAGVGERVADMVGHGAVMAECGPSIVLVGGVAVTALNAIALTHQIREWGPSEWVVAAVVATGTGLTVFFLAPAALPVIGAYLAEGEGIALASFAVKSAIVTGAINILTMPLAKLGRSIGLIQPGEKKVVQTTMERAAFLKTLTHLNAVAENLTEQARNGMLRPAIGREEELTTIMRTLAGGGERASVMLLGETGCGKTALINGLAYKIAANDVPEGLRNVEVFSVSMLKLSTNTAYRGQFETKLRGMLEEIESNRERIVLFVDEAHLMATVGAAENTRAMAEFLKAHLTRSPPLRLIGATTPREYNEAFSVGDPFRRRFNDIQVLRPNIPKTVEMIQGYYRQHWETHDLVQIDDEAILAAATFAQERLPDSAIKLLEELCSEAYSSTGGREIIRITEGHVRDVVAKTRQPAPALLPPVPEDREEESAKRPRSPSPEGRDEESLAKQPPTKHQRKPAPGEDMEEPVVLRRSTRRGRGTMSRPQKK
jgi:hypothetical protein